MELQIEKKRDTRPCKFHVDKLTVCILRRISAPRWTEKQMSSVVVFLDGGVALFPGGPLARVSGGLPVAAAAFRAADLLLTKVSPEHQIHGGLIGSLKF